MTTVVTITESDGNVFLDVTTDQDRDVSVIEALGIIALGKAIVIEQAAEA